MITPNLILMTKDAPASHVLCGWNGWVEIRDYDCGW